MTTEWNRDVRPIDGERRFRMAFDAAAVGIALVDLTGRVVESNGALHDLLGFDDGELRGRTFADLTYPPDRDRDAGPLDDVLADRRTSCTLERRYVRKNGSLVWAKLVASVVRDAGRTPRYAVGVVADITDQKVLEEMLVQSQKMATIGRQLLAASQAPARHLQVVDANVVARELEPMLARLVGDEIRLLVRTADAPCNVFVDAGQLQQVLLNLAVNARDAMPSGGTLLIETSEEFVLTERPTRSGTAPRGDRHIRISVADTGSGIPNDVQARVFEPFFTTKEPGHGIGLGLSTVYSIVKQADGFVRLQSDPRRGTTFDVLLPSARDAKPAERAGESVHPQLKRGGETLLLVEDDPAVRRLVERALVDDGFRVLAASTGEQALQISEAFPGRIHAVVTDIVMPGMHGPTLVARLEVRRPDIRVLFISGACGDTIEQHGVIEDEMEFLRKPFTHDQLTWRVRQILD